MKKMTAGETTSTGGTAASEFRAKVTHIKNWKAASPPSVSSFVSHGAGTYRTEHRNHIPDEC